MNNFSIRYSSEAVQDLHNIFDYISFELKEKEVAANLVKIIRSEIRTLNELPCRFPIVDFEPRKSKINYIKCLYVFLLYSIWLRTLL